MKRRIREKAEEEEEEEKAKRVRSQVGTEVSR